MSPDPMVKALTRLCGDPADKGSAEKRREVADNLGVNEQTLYQVLRGIPLPSGRPRGVGRKLREALDAHYPGWLTAADGDVSSSEAKPSLRAELTWALTVIRNQLQHGAGGASAMAGDALRLLAITPDSDRAFRNAIEALASLPPAATEPPMLYDPSAGSGAMLLAAWRHLAGDMAKQYEDPIRRDAVADFLRRMDQAVAAGEGNFGAGTTKVPVKIHED